MASALEMLRRSVRDDLAGTQEASPDERWSSFVQQARLTVHTHASRTGVAVVGTGKPVAVPGASLSILCGPGDTFAVEAEVHVAEQPDETVIHHGVNLSTGGEPAPVLGAQASTWRAGTGTRIEGSTPASEGGVATFSLVVDAPAGARVALASYSLQVLLFAASGERT